MPAALSALLSFYAFSSGRRLFALQEVKKVAVSDAFPQLASHCDVAIEHDRGTRIIEAQWSGRKVGQYSPLAKQIDTLVDTALSALHDGLDSEATNSAPDDPLAQQAEELRQTLFPSGVNAITSLNYIDELAEVERIVSIATSPKWEPVISALGLNRRVTRLQALEPQYRSAIADPATKLQFAEVRNARARGQSLLLQAVAIVLGRYPSDSEADIAARTKLLGPIFRQNDAIREYLRNRRAVVDIDPDTGVLLVIPEPGPDTEEKPE